MLIFVVYVLVISNWHANINSNWNAQYMLFVIVQNICLNWARAHEPPPSTRLAYLCSALRPSARASKGILHTTQTHTLE